MNPRSTAWRYERRRPEETALYQVVQEQFETFLAQVEAKTGAGLPEFVKDEFEAYLECAILARGFLRVRCADCADEKLVAFSDSQDKSGSATGLTIPRGPRSREAVKLRRNQPPRVHAGPEESTRERNFHQRLVRLTTRW